MSTFANLCVGNKDSLIYLTNTECLQSGRHCIKWWGYADEVCSFCCQIACSLDLKIC